MNKKFRELLGELDDLGLEIGDYAIFSGGVLAIKGIRETDNLDLIVKREAFNKLRNSYKGSYYPEPFEVLSIGNIEIFNGLVINGEKMNSDLMIDNAEIIDSYPFVCLKETLNFKEKLGTPKSIKDAELIKNYMKKEKDTCKK